MATMSPIERDARRQALADDIEAKAAEISDALAAGDPERARAALVDLDGDAHALHEVL